MTESNSCLDSFAAKMSKRAPFLSQRDTNCGVGFTSCYQLLYRASPAAANVFSHWLLFVSLLCGFISQRPLLVISCNDQLMIKFKTVATQLFFSLYLLQPLLLLITSYVAVTYEVSSIKNANLFIKYEGIKLQSYIWRTNFQQPLMLHPLKKHIEGTEDVDGVPLGIFFGGQSQKIKKKTCPIFFFF